MKLRKRFSKNNGRVVSASGFALEYCRPAPIKQSIMDNILKEFFKNNPEAPGVWKVGEQLFLQSRKANAIQHGKRFGLKADWVDNPNTAKKAPPKKETPKKETAKKTSSK